MIMSETQTILKFINQNKAKKSQSDNKAVSGYGSGWPIDSSSWNLVPKRIPLGHQFPFNRCDLNTLKDSRNSIKSGLQHSIKHYNDSSINVKRLINTFIKQLSPSFESNTKEEEFCVSPKVNSNLSLSPILSNKLTFDEDLIKIRDKISKLILKRFPTIQFDKDIKEVINFTINSFLQEFEAPDISTICNEIINLGNQGSLNEELDCLFIDQYNQVKVFTFLDYMLFHLSSKDDNSNSNQEIDLNNPKMYEKYLDIWKLNPKDFKDFDYKAIKSEIRIDSNYCHGLPDITDSYGEIGLLMNFEKFYHYFDQSLSFNNGLGKRKNFYIPNHKTNADANEQLELRMTLDRMRINSFKETKTKSPSPSLSNKKSLRFSDENKELGFYKSEPPSFINLWEDIDDRKDANSTNSTTSILPPSQPLTLESRGGPIEA